MIKIAVVALVLAVLAGESWATPVAAPEARPLGLLLGALAARRREIIQQRLNNVYGPRGPGGFGGRYNDYDRGYGGYNQGGYNQGGYNQGGYNQGGYNQGGYNQNYNQNPPVPPPPAGPVGPATNGGAGGNSVGLGTGTAGNGQATAVGTAIAQAPPGGFAASIGTSIAISTPFGDQVFGNGQSVAVGRK